MVLKNKVIIQIEYIIIPLMLIAFWVIVPVVLITSDSLSIVSSYPSYESVTTNTGGKILKGESIVGQITAKENNLGIVYIRIDASPVDYEFQDTVVFRIKEQGSQEWHSINTYRGGLFIEEPFFPFGIPKIPDSKGKVYEFELTSQNGNSRNAISLSSVQPVFATKYEYLTSDILLDTSAFFSYAINKIVLPYSSTYFILSSIPYLLPFVFYITWLIFRRRIEHFLPFFIYIRFIVKYPLLLTVVGFILIDILLSENEGNMIVFFVYLIAWQIAIKNYKLSSRATLLLVGKLGILSFVLMNLQELTALQKASSWMYVFLVYSIAQIYLEFKRVPRKIK